LIDSSKQFIGGHRHRMIFHHTGGVWWCERVFGRVLTIERDNGTVEVPVRLIAERHIIEDLGWLPSLSDYFDGVPLKPWVSGSHFREQALGTLGLRAPGPDVSDWSSPDDAVYDDAGLLPRGGVMP
jgi:hypothetical protein